MLERHKSATIFFGILIIAILAITLGVAWFYHNTQTSNPHNYKTIGDIPVPYGYERIDGIDAAYSTFLRSLPLKGKGEKVMLYTGDTANYQFLSYAVVDLLILSNAEQCADACMRLRAEYLFRRGRYGEIRFNDVNGKTMKYTGDSSRKEFEKYLRKVYNAANTFSLSRELQQRPLAEIQPGDVFVYAAADRPGNQYGHAIMVVDVARNPRTGKKMLLLAEGNTPARNIHVMRNLGHPFRSPWFTLDENADKLRLSVFRFNANELRGW
ncbi:MAG: hypothetical protein J6Y47_06960 [Bacteroidales bacterium]|nr:hypothetical protein [Bacteroidales bacterium]